MSHLEKVDLVLQSLLADSRQIWQDYLRLGPGCLESARMKPVDQRIGQLNELLLVPEIADVVNDKLQDGELGSDETYDVADARARLDLFGEKITQLHRLLRQSVCDPQGLSFVTGEAGLIPRRDLHEKMESLLVDFEALQRRPSK